MLILRSLNPKDSTIQTKQLRPNLTLNDGFQKVNDLTIGEDAVADTIPT
jgi:hypothetical protein